MRPPRIAILVLFLTASLFIVFRALTTTRTNVVSSYPSSPRASKSIFSFMYYNTPFSLFPPNAAISLTDDNSTSFAARPAAFGPKLAPLGLSGQLWVGSGFGEEGLDTDGELGCSDLPGWGSSNTRASLKNSFKVGSSRVASVGTKKSKKPGSLVDRDTNDANADDEGMPLDNARNDNTDDYLTRKVSGTLARRDAWNTHADIQSIQEAAEIEGKVVLLKRGGCGFLEKVMWAQRRGAIAVIVGDNQKGGPLIQMFAHGDEVDNVTVPSVFTARTTALLLSSLTQPGSFIEDTIDDNGKPVLKVQQSVTSKRENTSRSQAKTRSGDGTKVKRSSEKMEHPPAPKPTAGGGLLRGVFGWGASSHHVGSDSRPPRSGRLDWVRVDEWDDEKDKLLTDTMGKSTGSKANEDGFVIGVQDWRDPDLLDNAGNQRNTHEKTSPPSAGHANSRSDVEPGKPRGIMAKLFGGESGEASTHTQTVVGSGDETRMPPASPTSTQQPHQGLWVTITPTSSASPFFDTLLVLVISPLVTLTVVYALLVLRARIRRRRWRAPKSVVEQLPVRTYHTVAASPSASPRLPSSSAASPTTPLLQHSFSRPRPRSRTTTGVMESENFLAPSAAVSTPQVSARKPRQAEAEKGAGGFSAEWRKYMGRQVECVVCLEEYVDGVSRVMSLPCGHEFHADCITPWLTTRRRTCPICKGDVVRSLARGGSGGPRYEPYREDSDEGDDDAEGSGFTSADRESDLEQGTVASTARDTSEHQNRRGGFLGILSSSFNGMTRSPAQSPPLEDRSR